MRAEAHGQQGNARVFDGLADSPLLGHVLQPSQPAVGLVHRHLGVAVPGPRDRRQALRPMTTPREVPFSYEPDKYIAHKGRKSCIHQRSVS